MNRNISVATMEPASIIGNCHSKFVCPAIADPMIKPTMRMLKESRMILKESLLLIRSSLRRKICTCWTLMSSWSFPFRIVVVIAFKSFGRLVRISMFSAKSILEFSNRCFG